MSEQKKLRTIASNLLIKVTQSLRMFLPHEEVEEGNIMLLDKIRPESPESYAGIWGTRR